MADPTLTHSTTGTSATASTAASFGWTATANRLLLLAIAADDYSSGNPTGWSPVQAIGSAESSWVGITLWYKIAAGTETTVTYTIGSAAPSCWAVVEFDSTATSSVLDTSQKAWASGTVTSYTSPSITPTTGARRLAIAVIGGSFPFDTVPTGLSGWTNSYTEAADIKTAPASGTADILGVAYLTLDGGSATSTNATFDANAVQSAGGITASFNLAAAAASGAHPILVQGPSTAAIRASYY